MSRSAHESGEAPGARAKHLRPLVRARRSDPSHRAAASRKLRLVAQPVGVGTIQDLGPQVRELCRLPPSASVTAAKRPEPVRRAGNIGGASEPACRHRVIVEPPVIDEPDILRVMPVLRVRAQSLLQQRDRLVGPAGAARMVLGEKDCAEAIRNSRSTDRGTSSDRGADTASRIASARRSSASCRRSAGPRESSRHPRAARHTTTWRASGIRATARRAGCR